MARHSFFLLGPVRFDGQMKHNSARYGHRSNILLSLVQALSLARPQLAEVERPRQHNIDVVGLFDRVHGPGTDVSLCVVSLSPARQDTFIAQSLKKFQYHRLFKRASKLTQRLLVRKNSRTNGLFRRDDDLVSPRSGAFPHRHSVLEHHPEVSCDIALVRFRQFEHALTGSTTPCNLI